MPESPMTRSTRRTRRPERSPRWAHRAHVYVYPDGRVFVGIVSREADTAPVIEALRAAGRLEDAAPGLYVSTGPGEPLIRREKAPRGQA